MGSNMTADICVSGAEVLSNVIDILDEQEVNGNYLEARLPLLIFFTNEILQKKGQYNVESEEWLEKVAFEFCIKYFEKFNDSASDSLHQSCRKLLLLTSKNSYVAVKLVKRFILSINFDENNHGKLTDIVAGEHYKKLTLRFKILLIHDIFAVSGNESCDSKIQVVKNEALLLCIHLIKSEFISDSCFVIVCSLLKDLTKIGVKQHNEVVWETITFLHTDGNHKRLLIMLAIVLEVLTQSTIINKKSLWIMLQEGIIHDDPLTRKRALYIVKWLLDHISKLQEFSTEVEDPIVTWCKDKEDALWSVWKILILLLETLEEKQMHVIQPVLSLIDEVSAVSIKGNTGGILHSSWILLILRRCLKHESKHLNKFALFYCLQMEISFSRRDLHMLYPELLQSLQSMSIYAREETSCIGNPPPVLRVLIKFIAHCVSSEENWSYFIHMMLESLHSSSFNDISLVYFTEALSHQTFGMKLSIVELSAFKQFLISKIRIYVIEYQRVIFHNLSLFYINNMIPDKSNIASVINILTYAIDSSFLTMHGNCWNSWLLWLKAMPESCKEECISDVISEFISLHITLLKDHSMSASGFSYLFMIQYIICPKVNIKSALQCLTDITSKLLSNPYLDNTKVLRILKLQNCLLKAALDSHLLHIVAFLLANPRDSLEYIMYILDHLQEDCQYLEILDQCFITVDFILSSPELHRDSNFAFLISRFFDKVYHDISSNLVSVLGHFENMKMEDSILISRLFSIKLLFYYLSWVKDDVEKPSEIFLLLVNLLLKCNRQLLNQVCKESHVLQYISCDIFICFSWSCLNTLCEKCNFDLAANYLTNKDLLLDSFYSDITIVSYGRVNDVIKFGKHFIPMFIEDRYNLTGIIDCMLKVIQDLSQTDHSFWKVYKNCICTLFQKDLLNSDDEVVIKKLKETWNFILEEGERKMGVVNILISHCIQIWSIMEDPSESLLNYLDELVAVSMFGPLMNKKMKPKDDLICYLHKYGKYDRIMDLQSAIYTNQNVRIILINYFLSLNGGSNLGKFMNQFKMTLLDVTIKLSSSRKCYYPNTLIHRKLLRVWQLFLVLLSKYSSSLEYDIVLRKLFLSIKTAHQTSIRYLIEWAILLIFSYQNEHVGIVWSEMTELSEKKIMSVTSMISLVFHLSRLLKGEPFSIFVRSVVPKVLPWAHAQHMTSRLHAQVTLQTIWENVVKSDCQYLHDQFSFLSYCFITESDTSSVVKHRNELMKTFFYSDFHPINHYSLETIFYKFPLHMKVLSDEWISIDKFAYHEKADDSLFQLSRNDNLSLPSRINADCDDSENYVDEKLIDLQKKIMPWRISSSVEDEILQSELDKKKESKTSQLILCAVLVDKIPNLGGLCRTCEIFGVSSLVVGSYHYVEDQGFKSLSVSAERWMNIEQVLPIKLHSYLKEMRSDGYQIVGVEQTANSKMIGQYAFPEKTVLVVGNEKTGIPVDVIQLLDECVEIPQFGIIRSLNVHISGSIMIWEYCKQHLLDIT